MRFFRRSTEQGLTAYLRLPGRIAYARVDRRVAVPKLLAAGVLPVKGDNWGEALAKLIKAGRVVRSKDLTYTLASQGSINL